MERSTITPPPVVPPPGESDLLDPTTPPFGYEVAGDVVAHVFSYADARRVRLDVRDEFAPANRSEPAGPENEIVRAWLRDRGVAVLGDRAHTHAHRLIEQIIKHGIGRFDLRHDFAVPLAASTVCDLVGIPAAREAWLRDEIRRSTLGRGPWRPRVELESYLWQRVARRLAQPRDELLDALIGRWASGRLTERGLLQQLFGMAVGGMDPVAAAVVNAVAVPAAARRLSTVRARRHDGFAMELAVAEVMRFAPLVPRAEVVTRRAVTFGSLTLPAQARLIVHVAAANRSSRVSGNNPVARDPREFDPLRWPNHLLEFPTGGVAAPLARMQISVAWRELLGRLPGLSLDDHSWRYSPFGAQDGPVTMAFDQRAAERLLRLSA